MRLWIKLSSFLGAKRTTMRGRESTRTPLNGSLAVLALDTHPKLSTLNKWYRALEGAGVEFIDDFLPRSRRTRTKTVIGSEGEGDGRE